MNAALNILAYSLAFLAVAWGLAGLAFAWNKWREANSWWSEEWTDQDDDDSGGDQPVTPGGSPQDPADWWKHENK